MQIYPEDLRHLVKRWRSQGAVTDTFHATMGVGYKACAKELEDLLDGKLQFNIDGEPFTDEDLKRSGQNWGDQ
jgi:hypothetical protein